MTEAGREAVAPRAGLGTEHMNPNKNEMTMNSSQQLHDRIEQLGMQLDHLTARERARQTRRRLWLRRIPRCAALAGLIAGAIPLASHALDPVPAGQKLDGDAITADDWNANFDYLVEAISTMQGDARVCPPDMTRVGAHCIDDFMTPPSTWSSAVDTCHQDGKDLCSMEVIAACDSIEPVGTSCSDVTDGIEGLWVSTPSLIDGQTWTSNVAQIGPESVGNMVHLQSGDNLAGSFCCTPLPLLPPAQ